MHGAFFCCLNLVKTPVSFFVESGLTRVLVFFAILTFS